MNTHSPIPTAREAREQAGLTPDAAAKRLRIGTAYLRRLETGASPWRYGVAQRAADLYDCGLSTFLLPQKREVSPEGGESRGEAGAGRKRTGRPRSGERELRNAGR